MAEWTVSVCTRVVPVLIVVLGVAAPGLAQSNRPRAHPGSSADFMFGRPKAAVGVRGSWVFARAGSDLYDFVTEQLTVEESDFNGPAFGAELGIAITSRIEVIGGVEVTKSRTSSEYRAFVDNNNLPITQETEVENVHLGGAVRIALTPPGQSISRLAWVPRSVTPYVGAGAGVVHYEFLQRGDFVDFVDLSVFGEVFQSKGWAPSAHVFGGADIQIYRRLFLQLEGRYLWSSGELGSDFIDFDPIDLAGFRSTAGIRILF